MERIFLEFGLLRIAIHDGHTSAACLMRDGEVVFAVQEERLAREKNMGGFPHRALNDIFERYKLQAGDVDRYVFVGYTSATSMASRDAVLEKYGSFFKPRKRPAATRVKGLVLRFVPEEVLQRRAYEQQQTARMAPLVEMGIDSAKITFIEHHTCHAAAAAYGWGRTDEPVLVITSDSSGDGISGTVNRFENGDLERLAEINIDDGVGRIYSLVTYYMGMVPMEHEYKLMGMAPFSEGSSRAREIADYFKNLFEIDAAGLTYRRKDDVEPVYAMGPRLTEFLRYKRFDHVCAGLQMFIEEFITDWVHTVMRTTGLSNLALSGGLFMNVKLNKRIMELNEVEDMFVFPSCSDESNVFGAAYVDYSRHTGQVPQALSHYYLGGDFSDDAIKSCIESFEFENCTVSHRYVDNIEAEIARILAEDGIVARFAGRMEFGARALGNRSILANPANPDAVKTINKMIKNRDFWMPFAPSMTDSKNYIENPKGIATPYMIMTFDAKKDKIRQMIGAVQAYDETCRPQEVVEEWNPEYFNLISEYKKLTNESVVLNTSFNLHGYPLVYSPEDALSVFDKSGLECVALGSYLIRKN